MFGTIVWYGHQFLNTLKTYLSFCILVSIPASGITQKICFSIQHRLTHNVDSLIIFSIQQYLNVAYN